MDVFSLMRRFPVAIKQITLSKFVSVEDVNSYGGGGVGGYPGIYHENCTTVDSNNPTVISGRLIQSILK